MNTKKNAAPEGLETLEQPDPACMTSTPLEEFVTDKRNKTKSVTELERELEKVRKENEMLHWVQLESLRTLIELIHLPDDGHRRRRQNQMLDYVRYLGVFHLPPADWQRPKPAGSVMSPESAN